MAYKTVPSMLLEFGGKVTRAQTSRQKKNTATATTGTNSKLQLLIDKTGSNNNSGGITNISSVPKSPALHIQTKKNSCSGIDFSIMQGHGNNQIKKIVVDYCSPTGSGQIEQFHDQNAYRNGQSVTTGMHQSQSGALRSPT